MKLEETVVTLVSLGSPEKFHPLNCNLHDPETPLSDRNTLRDTNLPSSESCSYYRVTFSWIRVSGLELCIIYSWSDLIKMIFKSLLNYTGNTCVLPCTWEWVPGRGQFISRGSSQYYCLAYNLYSMDICSRMNIWVNKTWMKEHTQSSIQENPLI